MDILNRIKYLYSKCILYMQTPAIRNSSIAKKANVGHRSNLVGVSMGRYSYCGNNCSIVNTSIGSFCSIASYCAIGGGVHPQDEISTSPVFHEKSNVFGVCFQPNHKDMPKVMTTIGNDVWIGENAFIKQGVTIGNGAVIGAHSVVTKDVPDYAVVVGAPAKVVKYRFSENEIKELLESKWWEWPEDKLKNSDFSSIKAFVDDNQESFVP